MTAKTVVLPHESAGDYDEIRTALIEDYAPATSQEMMLVDQIAAGYWRTIRARRFETAMFDNHLRTKKLAHGKDPAPNERDDEGCAVILQVTDPEQLKNYFRYDATISRDYYRAIATLEKMQAARRREEDRQERKAAANDQEVPVDAEVNPIGFVSRQGPRLAAWESKSRRGGRAHPPTTSRNAFAAWLSARRAGYTRRILRSTFSSFTLTSSQQPLLDFLLDAHARQERHAFVSLHHLANRFDGRHLDIHIQRDFVALEFAQHHFAIGRHHVVRDERLHSQAR